MLNSYKFLLLWLLLGSLSVNTYGQDSSLVKSLTGKNLNQHIGLDKLNVDIGGWLTLGYTYNFWQPKDRSNGPVQFNNRANEFSLYQLGLYIDKPVDRKLLEWQIGGRFEFMFGTDTSNTQATGHWDTHLISQQNLRFYDIAFPQAYIELLAPIGNGISAKIGHFYSIIGYESVPSPPNLFVSHSYSMKSSPFTMSGALLSYQVNNNLTLLSGAVTGPDNMDSHAGAWSYLGGLNLETADHASGFTFSVLNGDIDDTAPSHLVYYYAMVHHDFAPNLHVVLEHDHGEQKNVLGNMPAEWYSLVNYITYDFNTHWNAGLRTEWFHDDDGTRFLTTPGNYYDISLAANWKPNSWLTLRPEVRYDWADGMKPFDSGTRENQWLLTLDAVIRF